MAAHKGRHPHRGVAPLGSRLSEPPGASRRTPNRLGARPYVRGRSIAALTSKLGPGPASIPVLGAPWLPEAINDPSVRSRALGPRFRRHTADVSRGSRGWKARSGLRGRQRTRTTTFHRA